MKQYTVEKLENNTWIYVGTFETSRQVATATHYSPSKTNQFIKNMTQGWNRLNDYRIGDVSK